MWKSGFRGRLVLATLIVSPAIASDVVRYNRSQTVIDPKQNYYIALLTLALQKVRTYLVIFNCRKSLLRKQTKHEHSNF